MTQAQIANNKQAQLLLDVELQPLLNLLMSQPQTISELAKKLDLKLNKIHYLIGKLERIDVVQVQREEARAGRAIKYYKVAQKWFIPFESTEEDSLELFGYMQIIPRMKQLIDHAVCILRKHNGQLGYWKHGQNLMIGDKHGPFEELFTGEEPFFINLSLVQLSDAKARELKGRMIDLVKEYCQPVQENSEYPMYTFGLMLVEGDLK